MRSLALLLLLSACGGAVDSEADAEFAWLGLEGALDKALDLGLQGFSEASSANIDPQEGTGDVSGTITVTGQVDQGASDNKGLRLDVELVDYQDLADADPDDDEEDLAIVYVTDPEALPFADLKLRNTPDGTFDGTFTGTVDMSGFLEGFVTLDLALSGPLESDGEGGTRRVEGETLVTGTVTNDAGGVFTVDIQN